MLLLTDAASIARVLTLDLNPQLRQLLQRRLADLHDLIDWTEFLIVQPGDTEADIICEVGFSPLVEPIDGFRYGSKGFQPYWDHLHKDGDIFELGISFGSSTAYVLLIEDGEGTLPDLRRLCRQYAA